jgi:hypothetical protein
LCRRSLHRSYDGGRDHATFSRKLAGAGGGVKFFSPRAFNIFSLLKRRLIFALRLRLNLALSPLIADIFLSSAISG